MTSRTRRAYAAGAATALLLTVGACTGGEDDPTASPTGSASSTPAVSSSSSGSPSASASTTPSASASASVEIPAAARANTDAGAIAFVRFWFDQLNIAYTKPDASILPALSTDECTSCRNLEAEPARYVKLGHKMQGPPTAPLRNLRVTDGAPAGRQFVRFTLMQMSVRVQDASGKIVDTQTAKTFERVAILSWEGSRWKLNGLAEPS